MSSLSFRPHGLMRNLVEEALYHRAHIANVYTGIADPKEHHTSALMEVILYSNIFTARENFMVNSQQPPAHQSDKRCDIVIRYLEQGTQKIRVLCFAECKRARTSQPFSLKALEKQAKEYCMLCLESEEDMQFVYAATMAGAHIRLWLCWRDQTELVLFWGSNNGGEWNQYKDVGDDKAGQEIEHWFGQMKQLPPTPHAGQNSHTYGTSSTIALGYQAPGSSYQASKSGYQTPVLDYQASLQTISPSLPVSQLGESVATGGQDQPMDEEVGDSEDDNEDDQMEGGVETQQAATSSAESNYHIVKVTMVAHTFSKNEFLFKDKKGKSRTTTRDVWRRITHNGRTAWKHHKYICFEDIFR